MLQAIVSYCACMMSDGYRIRAASLLYGSFFKNRTIWGVANIPYKSNSKPSLGCCPVLNPEVCRLALSVV